VGLLERLRPGGGARTFRVHVREDTRSFVGSKGDRIQSAGHVPLDASGAPLGDSEHRTSDPRVFHCRVAGTHYNPSALADPRFDPGSRVRVRAEPANPTDPNPLAIWDGSGEVQAGFVPVSLSRQIVALARRQELSGEVIRELRLGSEHGERIALYVLLAPAGRIELVER
jgi:hypothetical protein